MLKRFFLTIVFITCTALTFAQVSLTASVDKNVLTLDDEITLSVKLSGINGNIVMPTLPSLPSFNVYSRQVEQSSVNGHTTILFKYTMLPRFVGKATIGAITFEHKGQKYATEPISIDVYKATIDQPVADASKEDTSTPITSANLPPLEAALLAKASKHKEPFFLVAAVSNPNPYVNQSFILAVRFYYSKEFYDAPYIKPTVSNIFMEDLQPAKGSQTLHGALYHYEEQRYLLSAVATGKASIGPATVQFQTGNSPFSAFDRIFGGAAISEPQAVSSEAINLQIRPIPSTNIPSFYGAVGQDFTLKTDIHPKQVEVGEAINVSITVKGSGNLKSTKDLQFPAIDGFNSYPAAASAGNTTQNNSSSLSYKTFKEVLVPVSSGIYTIPAIEWTFFNPKTQKFVTLHSTETQITVIPSSKTESSANFLPNQTAGTGFKNLGTDIIYIKTNTTFKPLFFSNLAKLDLVTILVAVLSGLLLPIVLILRKATSSKNAYNKAKNCISSASTVPQISDGISKYLAERLQISTASQPLKEIAKQLTSKGVSKATTQSFSLLWERLEAARFAPAELAKQNATELAIQTLDVVKLIEGELK